MDPLDTEIHKCESFLPHQKWSNESVANMFETYDSLLKEDAI